MTTTYNINADSLDLNFINSIKSNFKNKDINITISEIENLNSKVPIDISNYNDILEKNQILEELLFADQQIKNGDFLTNDNAKVFILNEL